MKPKLTDKQKQKIIDKHEQDILKHIREDIDLCFIQEIFIGYSGCTSSTFYLYGLEKSEDIIKALEYNRTVIKQEMRGNWKKKDAGPALQVSAYKLMGTESERKKLSQTFIESTGAGGGPIQYSDMTEEQINKRLEELRNQEDE